MAGIGHRGFMGRKKEPVGLPFIFSVTVGSGQSFQLPTVITGTYDAIIDWGDGGSDVLTVWDSSSRNHTYASAGTYDIKISGVFSGWSVNNYSDRLKITEVKQWGVLKLGIGLSAFWGCSNMTISATDVLDTSACTNFGNLFQFCTSITSIPNIGLWDVSGVTNMAYCFRDLANFNEDISEWNVGNVISFGLTNNNSGMFYGCGSFNQDLSGWDVSNAQNMVGMFGNCISFNQDLSGWDVSSCTNMNYMFLGCSSFNANISGWDVSSVQFMRETFRGCPLFNADISGWGVSACQSFLGTFHSCSSFNADISGWDTSSATTMRLMFSNATSFNRNIGGWDVSGVTDFINMFDGATLSTGNYDSLLIGWASQAVQSGIGFNGGNSKYTPGGAAEAARDTLINTYGWTITDGGAA